MKYIIIRKSGVAMPREARSKYNGVLYHVMTQGINKEKIFYNDKYKRIYIKLILKNAERYHIKIIAYCIMINHAHLLLQVNDTKEMSEFMKIVNMKYAMLYNNLEERVGVVFRNRFKSEYIYDEEYFYNCIQYIHNNPVKAEIVRDKKDYRFSSANNYNLNVILSNINKRIGKQDYELVNFIDTDIDKKIITEKKISEIIEEYKNKYGIIEINLKNKKILKSIIEKIKIETNVNNNKIAKRLRNIKIYSL